jgi:hypothetical protein
MYINAVTSSMGAWRTLNKQHCQIFRELENALGALTYRTPEHANETSVGLLHQALNMEMETLGWDIGKQISLRTGKRTFFTIDFLKNGIAGKLIFGKQAYVLSSLLAHFPLCVQIHTVDLGIVLLPMHSLREHLPKGISDYEFVCKVVLELPSALIKYPFLIVGFSEDKTPLDVCEITSELDELLMQRIGYTLSEILILGEKPSYDFKVAMPPRTEKITKEVCAMANLPGGGVLLFGISDEGDVVGMNPEDLDLIKLRITTSVRTLCDPIPAFDFFSVSIAEDPDRVILVCQVEELKRKPCLVHGRIYIRSGPSAQTADSEEIRRMVLGSV